MKRTRAENAFQAFDLLFMFVVLALVLCPIMYVVSVSVSNTDAILHNEVTLFPVGFNVRAYAAILENPTFLRSLFNTVGLTVAGSLMALLVTTMAAYALTLECVGKKFLTYFYVCTMYFSGGLIPTYIVYTNYLNLRNTYLVLILPSLFSMFYAIVIRSQIEAIPSSIFEAAYIDGANVFQTLFRITLPVIVPTMAAVGMFFALSKWNMWYNVMLYESTNTHWTLQYFLRVVVFDKFLAAADSMTFIETETAVSQENYRMAAIVLAAAPIVCIYPFVQKYFVKGIITGAVKG